MIIPAIELRVTFTRWDISPEDTDYTGYAIHSCTANSVGTRCRAVYSATDDRDVEITALPHDTKWGVERAHVNPILIRFTNVDVDSGISPDHAQEVYPTPTFDHISEEISDNTCMGIDREEIWIAINEERDLEYGDIQYTLDIYGAIRVSVDPHDMGKITANPQGDHLLFTAYENIPNDVIHWILVNLQRWDTESKSYIVTTKYDHLLAYTYPQRLRFYTDGNDWIRAIEYNRNTGGVIVQSALLSAYSVEIIDPREYPATEE